MKNSLGRTVPNQGEGVDASVPFVGAFATPAAGRRYAPPLKYRFPGTTKRIASLEDVFRAIPVRNGMTLSFHHHFRNGDKVLNLVLETAAKLDLKDLRIAVSSIFPVHEPLIGHINRGTVSALDTNYMSGPVAQAISHGILANPVMMRTHGGRARAIECGSLHVDVAFIAAPAADSYGNITGLQGTAACGSLGYAMPDAEFADHVVAITDCLLDYPLSPISIPQTRVDYVVTVDRVGDPAGIVSGTTRLTNDPLPLKMAADAATVIEGAGLIREGFSFQTGAGGASLASAQFVREMMERAGVTGSFILGGITAHAVDMVNKGIFRKLLDVQGFDLEAVKSIAVNPNHVEISSSFYANPFNSGCAVNQLDCVVLGATEIDVDFNVNVATGSDGIIRGGAGGHSDAAAGAALTMIVAKLNRGRYRTVVENVTTVTTPGETVDVLVTDHGIAVNPRRRDLVESLMAADVPIKDIHELRRMAESFADAPAPSVTSGRTVAVVEYRDGTIIDTVRQIGC